MIVAIVYFDREGYNDSQHPDRELTLVDTVYYATVTLTTTGYGDIVPATAPARLVNAVLITPLRIMFLILLVGTTLEVLASQGREQLRITRWRRHMRDHVIVVGYGTKGRSAVQTLISHGVAKDDIVIIDPSSAASSDAQADGLACIVGDATRRDILARAEVHKAQQIVVTADRDDAAVLVTLMARQSNGHAYIVVAVREEQNVDLVRQSGADATVTSSEAVGRLLGLSTVSPGLGTVLDDLLTSGEGSRGRRARRAAAARRGKSPQHLATRSSASSVADACTATSTLRSPSGAWRQADRVRPARRSTCRGPASGAWPRGAGEPLRGGSGRPSDEPGRGVVDAAKRVVVDRHAVDATVTGEDARLRLDLLGGEHTAYRGQQRVAVEELEVAGQLLDPVDVAAPLDLHRDAGGPLRHGTSGPRDRSRWGTPGVPGQPGPQGRRWCSASSSCRCFSTPSLRRARVGTHLVRRCR
jgi:voltage-gated potassium channel